MTTSSTRSAWRPGTTLKKGRTTYAYQFRFDTTFRNRDTILQSYLGVIGSVGDGAQNLIQRYTVTKVDYRTGVTTPLGRGIVPPNNQGIATPKYNRNNDGDQPARDGVADEGDLDVYTAQSIAELKDDYSAFAGQRDDGFYADMLAVFDLLKLRAPGKAVDSQGGFNVHTMALRIPLAEIGGDQQIVGVYATTSRKRVRILAPIGDANQLDWVQVARQGNPLFNEGLVAIRDKDLYSRTSPEFDAVPVPEVRPDPGTGGPHQQARPRIGRGADDEPDRHRRHLHPRPDQGRPLDRAGTARGRRAQPSDQS